MEKKELKEEIKKVLEGKSIYEMSPISGLNPMTKEDIIYWIVETYIDQELDKAREEGFVSGYVEANGDCNMLLKWKSYKQPKRTQVQAIKTTEEKQEKYLKKYIKLKQ